MSIASQRGQQGLTLVEMIIFVVIISVALVGILVVMNITSQHSGDAQMRKQALSIAEGILEEVEMARFTYCDPQDANAATALTVSGCASIPEAAGPENGNVRPFDNVNDYINIAGGAKLGKAASFALADVNSNGIANIPSTYSAQLTISTASLQGMEADPGASSTLGSVLQITVEVDYAGGNKVVLDGYRTQYAPNLMPIQ